MAKIDLDRIIEMLLHEHEQKQNQERDLPPLPIPTPPAFPGSPVHKERRGFLSWLFMTREEKLDDDTAFLLKQIKTDLTLQQAILWSGALALDNKRKIKLNLETARRLEEALTILRQGEDCQRICACLDNAIINELDREELKAAVRAHYRNGKH